MDTSKKAQLHVSAFQNLSTEGFEIVEQPSLLKALEAKVGQEGIILTPNPPMGGVKAKQGGMRELQGR